MTLSADAPRPGVRRGRAPRYDADFTDTPRSAAGCAPPCGTRLAATFTPGARVLELGCGTGEDAAGWRGAACRVVATDASPGMLRRAAAKVAAAAAVAHLSHFARLDLRPDALEQATRVRRRLLAISARINCVADRRPLARRARRRVRRAGRCGRWCVMGPLCPWEIGLASAARRPARAVRRFARARRPCRRGATLPVWYPSPRTARRGARPCFAARAVGEGIGIAAAAVVPGAPRRAPAARVRGALARALNAASAPLPAYVVPTTISRCSNATMMRRRLWRACAAPARFLLFQRHRYDRLVLEHVAGSPIVVLPEVFNPSCFAPVTFLVVSSGRAARPPGARCSTWAPARASAAVAAARRAGCVVAVDINPRRCAARASMRCSTASRTAWTSARATSSRRSSGERFDVVLFNPPYYRGTPRDALDRAWRAPRPDRALRRRAARPPRARAGRRSWCCPATANRTLPRRVLGAPGMFAQRSRDERTMIKQTLYCISSRRAMLILYNPPSSPPQAGAADVAAGAGRGARGRARRTAIVDGNLEPDPLAALDRVDPRHGADVLGVTVMPGPQLSDAVPLCRELKARHPRPDHRLGRLLPDPALRGRACARLRRLRRPRPRRGGIPGADRRAARAATTRPHCSAWPIALPGRDERDRPTTSRRSRIPTSCRTSRTTGSTSPRYVRPTFMGRRTLPHHSSYGCPFLCNFCAVVNMVNGRWLAQSAERTANVRARW